MDKEDKQIIDRAVKENWRIGDRSRLKHLLKKNLVLSCENAELEQQIEKMKCCQNCKHLKSLVYGEFSCDLYGECKHCSKWEIKEND